LEARRYNYIWRMRLSSVFSIASSGLAAASLRLRVSAKRVVNAS
jgi:flagellar basal body rod protein FlgC